MDSRSGQRARQLEHVEGAGHVGGRAACSMGRSKSTDAAQWITWVRPGCEPLRPSPRPWPQPRRDQVAGDQRDALLPAVGQAREAGRGQRPPRRKRWSGRIVRVDVARARARARRPAPRDAAAARAARPCPGSRWPPSAGPRRAPSSSALQSFPPHSPGPPGVRRLLPGGLGEELVSGREDVGRIHGLLHEPGEGTCPAFRRGCAAGRAGGSCRCRGGGRASRRWRSTSSRAARSISL